ncbi:TPA: phage tail tape measure protein, partial [Escherichia coli]
NEQIYADRVAEINQKNSEKLQDIQNGYTTASLSMFSDLTGQSAELLKGLGQEGSAAYKALFVASKAAAVAQAIINTELAATKAMAEGGMILGIPAATAMRAVGYASVALIAGQTLAGMAHDGIDRVPETGTWLLQKGERVVTASTSAKLDATLEKVQQVQRERQVVSGGSI